MKELAKKILSLVGRHNTTRHLDFLDLGRDSQIYFWRVRSAHGGRLSVGCQSRLETRLTFERKNACLTMGQRSFIGEGQISCASSIEIGDDVMVAWGTSIFDHSSHSIRFSERADDVTSWLRGEKNWAVVSMAPVRICNKAWIGFGCIVLPGVTIGEGAVIGAGSVVTRDVPPWTVSVGNPARQIRELNPDER